MWPFRREPHEGPEEPAPPEYPEPQAEQPERSSSSPVRLWWTDTKSWNPFSSDGEARPQQHLPPAPPPPALRGKFVVTGGTDGIGRFTVESLAEAGHIVIVHGRRDEEVQSVLRDLIARGAGGAYGYVADLSSMAEVRRLGEAIARDHPKINGILNNAATFNGDYTTITETSNRVMTAEGNEYSLAVNVRRTSSPAAKRCAWPRPDAAANEGEDEA